MGEGMGELTTPVHRSADLVAFASALFRQASIRSEWHCPHQRVSGAPLGEAALLRIASFLR
jgi:hypothetical protein